MTPLFGSLFINLLLDVQKISKLITFQLRILHIRLATNKKIRLKEDNDCTFCDSEVETLIHPFWSSRVSHFSWQGFNQWPPLDHRIEPHNVTEEVLHGRKFGTFEFARKAAGD